jgi:hypothetical protein
MAAKHWGTPKVNSRDKASKPRARARVQRALIEAGFIIFLFYSNLLMGEYTRSNAASAKPLAYALADIFTAANFAIALVTSCIGYVVVEYLRIKL